MITIMKSASKILSRRQILIEVITSVLTSDRERSQDLYELKLYDEDLLKFKMEESGLEGLRTEIVSLNRRRKKYLPLDLKPTNEGLTNWLKRRVIPKNRAFVIEVLSSMGLNYDDTKGIIDVCKVLSLNDSYWVVPSKFEGKFKDYNLYENRFSEVLSLIAYTGAGRSREIFTTSPEFTTHGMLRKAWRYIEGDGIYLYKGGTEGFINSGLEPYSEYYASQIASRMGLKHVHYDLEKWKNILASKCELFTDINTAYVPIGYIVGNEGLQACVNFYERISPEALEDLKSMLVFDALIYNEDRHYGNFGVLVDSRTCKILGVAPIFDNGMSLFNYAMAEDIKNLRSYAKTRGNHYGISYDKICREVMGSRQRQELKRMINFQFKRHEKYNLPERRLRAIERQLQVRMQELLSLGRSELYSFETQLRQN